MKYGTNVMWNYDELSSEVTNFMEEVVMSEDIQATKQEFLAELENAVPAPIEQTETEAEYGRLLCDEYAFNGYITEEDELRKSELEIQILKEQITPSDTYHRVCCETNAGRPSDLFAIGMFDENGMFEDFYEVYDYTEKSELECWRELVTLNGKTPKI